MTYNDDATRQFLQRDVQRNQTVVANRAELLGKIDQGRRAVPERLRAAGYPTNKFSAMCVLNGRQQATWVVQLSESKGEWAGVLPDGLVVAVRGSGSDRDMGRLQIIGPYDFDSAPVMYLAAINALIEGCTQAKRHMWEMDDI